MGVLTGCTTPASTPWRGHSTRRSSTPSQEFQTKVGLTGVERDPDVKRFYAKCAMWQIRRKFAQMCLMFPRCPGCFLPAPPGMLLPPSVPVRTTPGARPTWTPAGFTPRSGTSAASSGPAVTAFNRVMVQSQFVALLEVFGNQGWPFGP
ncbi:hypothetical protein PG997_014352 [Apiospora hydei]|uniref:Uncharacterized protein n=1 Tax=Apiospora hydei TaxID=1337664 RepID=A0ABR1UW31_9PEZI